MRTIDLAIPKGAIFSEDRKYRYALWRVWSLTLRPMMLIGLNPSKANEIMNDPTVVRSMTRAANEGYGGLLMANLFAMVSTDPRVLLTTTFNTVGVDTDAYLRQMLDLSGGKAVCAWGSFSATKLRSAEVLKMIPEPYCLGVNGDGQPKHPLYIGYNIPIKKYTPIQR